VCARGAGVAGRRFSAAPQLHREMAQMNLADFHILRVDRVHDGTLAPLLKQYCREMRAWMAPTSDAAEGFTYPLEKVWNVDTHVYLAHVADIPAGFALVGSAQSYVGDPQVKDMVEFFVAGHLRRIRASHGRTHMESISHQVACPCIPRQYAGHAVLDGSNRELLERSLS
jgi:hypothetical protein